MIKKGSKVKLNPTEEIISAKVAETRSNVNRKLKSKTNVSTDQQGYEIDLMGFAGEMAFCKLANVMPDFSSDPRSAANKTDTGDVTYKDKRIDIKTTKYLKGNLVVGNNKKGIVDGFVLMTGTIPNYKFSGYMDSDKVFQDKYKTKDGKSYSIPQGDLSPLS